MKVNLSLSFIGDHILKTQGTAEIQLTHSHSQYWMETCDRHEYQ